MKPYQIRIALISFALGVRELGDLVSVTLATVMRFQTEKGGLQLSRAEAMQNGLAAHRVQFLYPIDTASAAGAGLAGMGT